MVEQDEYILGTDREELERLRVQHEVWREQALDLFRRAGFAGGASVLDLGCGPGYTSVELARVVGPSGRVIARDASAGFVAHLAREVERLGLAQVAPSVGPVEELELEASSLDGAYARWLLCWLPDPGAALARVAAALRPGGVVALQEYLDWAAMKLVPRCAAFDRAVDACMRSWERPIDVGEELPALAASCGLRVEDFRPVARAGGPGSPEWTWLGGFFESYLPRLVARRLFDGPDLAAFRRAWRQRTEDGVSRVVAPVMVDAVLRR